MSSASVISQVDSVLVTMSPVDGSGGQTVRLAFKKATGLTYTFVAHFNKPVRESTQFEVVVDPTLVEAANE
jgi:predicted membrane GTPase involved in stress response